jgi:flagellar hook-length control protein FliK
MQSSPFVDTSGTWKGAARSVSTGSHTRRTETRSPETASTDSKEDAFPEVLKQVATPVRQRSANRDSAALKTPSDSSVSSDTNEKIKDFQEADSLLESGAKLEGMTPAWLSGLLDGLGFPVSALQAGMLSSGGATPDALGAIGTGKGRSPLDAILQRLQNVLEGQDALHPDGSGMLDENLSLLQKSLTGEAATGNDLLAQLESLGDLPDEGTPLPVLVTIRHTAGQQRVAGESGDSQVVSAEGAFALDSDPEARVQLRKLASLREGESAFSGGNGSDPQNLVSVQRTDLRPAELSTDRFSLDTVASLRHVDLTNAVRQAQVAIADMTERMQGEVSLNTESLKAVLRLDPPALGRLNIRLEIDDTQRVTAYLHADQAQTGDFLRQNEGDLRQGFERQGFDSDKVQFVYEEGETGNFDQWLTEKTVSV